MLSSGEMERTHIGLVIGWKAWSRWKTSTTWSLRISASALKPWLGKFYPAQPRMRLTLLSGLPIISETLCLYCSELSNLPSLSNFLSNCLHCQSKILPFLTLRITLQEINCGTEVYATKIVLGTQSTSLSTRGSPNKKFSSMSSKKNKNQQHKCINKWWREWKQLQKDQKLKRTSPRTQQSMSKKNQSHLIAEDWKWWNRRNNQLVLIRKEKLHLPSWQHPQNRQLPPRRRSPSTDRGDNHF